MVAPTVDWLELWNVGSLVLRIVSFAYLLAGLVSPRWPAAVTACSCLYLYKPAGCLVACKRGTNCVVSQVIQ